MSLRLALVAGALAALAQLAFLYYFAAPLAESLHDKLAAAEGEEEYAERAPPLVAMALGAAWAVPFHYLSMRHGVVKTATLMFVAFSLLPGLRWLPTPHGVSYAEPVWWREAVHGAYLLYNLFALLLVLRGGLAAVAGAAALAAGPLLIPSFTLPDKYAGVVPELRALQGLSLASWALFWGSLAFLTLAFAPLRRLWRL